MHTYDQLINKGKLQKGICIIIIVLKFLSKCKVFNNRFCISLIEWATNWLLKIIIKNSFIK